MAAGGCLQDPSAQGSRSGEGTAEGGPPDSDTSTVAYGATSRAQRTGTTYISRFSGITARGEHCKVKCGASFLKPLFEHRRYTLCDTVTLWRCSKQPPLWQTTSLTGTYKSLASMPCTKTLYRSRA